MTIHIVKLCVGADSVEDLAEWQIGQIKRAKKEKRKLVHPVCGTRMWPKRVEDVLAGGSLYWVIKGVVTVRQRILAIDDVTDDHGQRCTNPEDVERIAAVRGGCHEKGCQKGEALRHYTFHSGWHKSVGRWRIFLHPS